MLNQPKYPYTMAYRKRLHQSRTFQNMMERLMKRGKSPFPTHAILYGYWVRKDQRLT